VLPIPIHWRSNACSAGHCTLRRIDARPCRQPWCPQIQLGNTAEHLRCLHARAQARCVAYKSIACSIRLAIGFNSRQVLRGIQLKGGTMMRRLWKAISLAVDLPVNWQSNIPKQADNASAIRPMEP
jgi:hypothetical protein